MAYWLQRGATALLLLGIAIGAEFTLHQIVPDTAWRQVVMLALVYVVVALSLNVINGMAGQFSIGHAGFVGLGAYTGAIVASHLHKSIGMPNIGMVGADPVESFTKSLLIMPPAIIAAALVAGAFGLLVGLPSLRLKGDYLAIVTLGFAEIFRLLISTANPQAPPGTLAGLLGKLGGQQGYGGPDDVGVAQYAGPFWIVGGVLLSIVVAWRLKFSGWGRAIRAIREDEIAAAAVGVDPTSYKVTSFVISSMGAGVAGALLASMRDGNPTVQPDQFNFFFSFDAITMVIIGGSGSVSGAVLGGIIIAVALKLIEQLQRLEVVEAFRADHPDFDLNALRMVVYAAVLILLMILRPSGIFGERELVQSRRSA
jgi:branched-chain amino acid transport system permease protein